MTMLKNGLASAHHKRTLLVLTLAWNTFVRNINLPELEKILVEVTIHLLPLLQKHPDPKEVGSIYHFLIIENGDAFKDTMSELFFLAGIEKLDKEIREFLIKSKSDETEIEAAIRKLLKGIGGFGFMDG
jgi:hypothetical protein